MQSIEAFVGLLEDGMLFSMGRKTLNTINRSTSTRGAGGRRYGNPRSDIERLQRHFGSDWVNHDVSELPPRGTGLKRTPCKRGSKPRKRAGSKRRSRSRR